MIKHKDYVEIESHVSKMKIRGWENYKNFKYENAKVHYVGIADGKRFNVVTEGNELIKNIIDRICKVATDEH